MKILTLSNLIERKRKLKTIKKFLLTIITLFLLSHTVQAQIYKLITFNIRYDNKLDKENNWNKRRTGIANFIHHFHPAILGIQEGLYNQVNFLDSSLTDCSYIGVGRKDGKKKGEYSAIFYDRIKINIIKQSTFWLSETPDTSSIGWDAALERICTYGLFEDQKSKTKFWVFNTHFDHIGKRARERSARLILNRIYRINKYNLPLVLMGDLNAAPNEKPVRIFSSKLDIAQKISRTPLQGPSGTFNGFSMDPVVRKIDYFFTKGIEVQTYAHIDARLPNGNYLSDHLPVMITIIFPMAAKNKNH